MEQFIAPAGVSLKNILVAKDFSASSVSALACVGLIVQASDSVVQWSQFEVAVFILVFVDDLSGDAGLRFSDYANHFRKWRLTIRDEKRNQFRQKSRTLEQI